MKRFFARRSSREQALILAFGLIALAWWGTALAGRVRQLRQVWRDNQTEQQTQELWLKNRDSIMARVKTAGQTLDPAKALDSAQSFAELNTMLQGLNAEIGSQRTEKTDQFAVHSMQVNIRQAGLAEVLKFYQQLSAQAPYLGIDQCVLGTDRANPSTINASFRVYSIEVISPRG